MKAGRRDASIEETSALIYLGNAKQQIGLAKDIHEIKDIRDNAITLQELAKRQKLGLEMQNDIAEIRLYAERKAGELLKETDLNKGVQMDGSEVVRDDTRVKLKDFDITRDQSSNWQRIAEIPQEEFDKKITETKSEGKELTTTGMLRTYQTWKRTNIQYEDIETPEGKYRVFYADPPWKYNDSGVVTEDDNYGRAERHYKTMSTKEICELPIKELTDENAVLFLWVTSPFLEDGFKVISSWGFEYKTSFVWDKIKHNFGHYNSVRHEFLLVCTKGSCIPDAKKLYDSVVSIERSKVHSEKPDFFRKMIDELYTHGNRIELFGKKENENWTVWGNQVT